MNTEPRRQRLLDTLENYEHHNDTELLKALYDIRYNTGAGDEVYIFRLFAHQSDAVVASALFTLWHAYGLRDAIAPLIKKFAWGDVRDCMEQPIQSMAVTLLVELAKSDPSAYDEVRAIAEDASVGECPRNRAWQGLAEIHGVEWLPRYSNEMLESPDSMESEQIRVLVRNAAQTAMHPKNG